MARPTSFFSASVIFKLSSKELLTASASALDAAGVSVTPYDTPRGTHTGSLVTSDWVTDDLAWAHILLSKHAQMITHEANTLRSAGLACTDTKQEVKTEGQRSTQTWKHSLWHFLLWHILNCYNRKNIPCLHTHERNQPGIL